MFLEADPKVHDLMLKQRRLVLPVTATTAGADISSVSAEYQQICEVAADDVSAITALDADATVNGTGLVANVLAHKLGTVTQILAVEVKDPLGAAPADKPLTLARVTTNGNMEFEITLDDGATDKVYSLVVDYMVER